MRRQGGTLDGAIHFRIPKTIMKNPTLIALIIMAWAMTRFSDAQATLVQILHTNDTHSFLDNSTHSTTRGGAARLKSMIDLYKNEMSEKGVKTLVVDSGDFLEGNVYFMAENGKKSFEVHNQVGYDIGTLGNHDYQMGPGELDNMLGEMNLNFSLIVANINPLSQYKNIKEKVKPYKEIEIDGVKIAFLGLTTDEMLYKWRLTNGATISDPITTAQSLEPALHERNDFIIALTHIGVLRDIKLAERTKYLDLIIGGHSHTSLFTPTYGVSKKTNKRVPIVQAGQHTEFLGRLVVDLVKGKPLKIVSYELVPVVTEEKDSNIKELVEQADQDLDASYGKVWLAEKIGYSDLSAGDPLGTRKWAYFIADAMREKTGADIAIHAPDMNGANFPVGDISRRTILNSMPRVFETNQKYGWDIYTTKIRGAWLRLTMDALSYVDAPLTFSGLTMEYERGPLGFKIRNILVNGRKVNPFKTYTVVFTEGIIKGAKGIDPRTVAIIRNPLNTHYKIWATLEERVKRNTKPMSLICEEGHTMLWPRQ
jgi:5'-nucleotidase/UDP-sugar diphosphatase